VGNRQVERLILPPKGTLMHVEIFELVPVGRLAEHFDEARLWFNRVNGARRAHKLTCNQTHDADIGTYIEHRVSLPQQAPTQPAELRIKIADIKQRSSNPVIERNQDLGTRPQSCPAWGWNMGANAHERLQIRNLSIPAIQGV
jgi:hypothetical protein